MPMVYRAGVRRSPMQGTITDKLKSSWQLIAVLVAGVAVGYLARKPIAKIVGKVT